MRRRLTVAIVGVAVGALVVAALGTLLLARLDARDRTRSELVDDVEAVARSLPPAALDERPPPGGVRARDLLPLVRRVLRLEGSGIVRIGPGGRVVDADLPAGVALADLDLDRLAAGETLSGSDGDLVWAAAQARPPRRGAGFAIVVLSREAGAELGGAVAWFALAGAGTAAVAWAVAARLGGRLTRRLQETEAVTRRIAAGDLSARVPSPLTPSFWRRELPPEREFTSPERKEGDELASLVRSINALAADLERSRKQERQFLLSVSHDLRTPLTSIRGFAEAIAEGAAPDHGQAAAVIAAEARRLERLVRDLLDLANLQARRFSLDLRVVDVAEVVRETAEGFRPAADEVGVALSVTVPTAMTATADPDRLAQVVANLVENALKFAAGRVDVAVTQADNGGDVVVRVDDDGPGIPAGERARLFEPLYSPTRAPARQVGSGLGLAIVRELVEAMRGSVEAEAAPGDGGGARLTVRLPA